ncbi:MAG: hypothetical protein HYZ62_01675 [Candidatus Andersenbacteria bacterium]|nr:hypothetical protein [Candidatus Andersenbacteria bacterium]
MLPYFSQFESLFSPGILQGALAALICTLAVCLLYVWPKRAWLIVSCIIIGITPLALGGFWLSDNALGISDWDYYFSYHHFLRESMMKFHTFPQWNPYTCGGTAALGDPEFPVISATFPLELAFGVEDGFRLAIYLSIAAGGLGMLALARRLGLSPWAGLLAAIGYCFGSVNLLEIVEGHQNILSAMWIPWIFWSWYAAYHASCKYGVVSSKQFFLRKYVVLCAVFLALMFYAGGIYLLMYTGLAFLGFIALAKNHKQALVVTVISGCLALGLAAFKLIPVFLWLSQFQDQAYASSALTLPYLHKILLGRYLHGAENIIPNQGGGWHEYGAYIGPFLLALAAYALMKWKTSRLVRLLVLAAGSALAISSLGPMVKPFFDQASFLPRSNISRFILFAIIPLCLLAGIGLDNIHFRKRIISSSLRHLLLFLVAADLLTLAYPLSQQAFVLPRNATPVPPAPAPIAYSAFEYKTRYQGIDYSRAYEATLAGYGSLSYCAVLGPDPAVRTIHDEEDNAFFSVKSTSGQLGNFALKFWNANTAIVDVSLPSEGNAILNTNYAKGWRVNGQPALNISGRVGARLPAGNQQITFAYQSPGILAGKITSLLSLLPLGYSTILYAISAFGRKKADGALP